MTKIKQLQAELGKLSKAYDVAKEEFDDPLYIAWMVDFMFDSDAPAQELRTEFSLIFEARQSQAFRKFWNAYKDAKAAMSNFQMVNMGAVSESTRRQYRKRFRREHAEEVPF